MPYAQVYALAEVDSPLASDRNAINGAFNVRLGGFRSGRDNPSGPFGVSSGDQLLVSSDSQIHGEGAVRFLH